MNDLYKKVISLVETNQLKEAGDKLLDYARDAAPEKEPAVRLLRSNLNEIEQEELLFGRTASIRDRRNQLKLQVLQLAGSIKVDAAEESSVDKSGLKATFRSGGPEALLKRLGELIGENHSQYDELILLEQSWKDYKKAEQNNLATSESLTVQRNQLHQQMLDFIDGL